MGRGTLGDRGDTRRRPTLLLNAILHAAQQTPRLPHQALAIERERPAMVLDGALQASFGEGT